MRGAAGSGNVITPLQQPATTHYNWIIISDNATAAMPTTELFTQSPYEVVITMGQTLLLLYIK